MYIYSCERSLKDDDQKAVLCTTIFCLTKGCWGERAQKYFGWLSHGVHIRDVTTGSWNSDRDWQQEHELFEVISGTYVNRLEYLVCNSLVFTDRVDQILRMLEAARNLSSILVSWQKQKRKLTCLEKNGELRIYCHCYEPCGHFFFTTFI